MQQTLNQKKYFKHSWGTNTEVELITKNMTNLICLENILSMFRVVFRQPTIVAFIIAYKGSNIIMLAVLNNQTIIKDGLYIQVHYPI